MLRSDWDEFLEIAGTPAVQADSVEERLTLLEDEREIRETVFRYGYFLDAHRWDELFELFCDDVVRVLRGSVEQVTEGKAALRALYDTEEMPLPSKEGEEAQPLAQDALASKHHYSSPLIRVSGARDRAWLVTHYTVILTDQDREGPRTGSHHGSSIFTFRPETGRWRICHQINITNVASNPLLAKNYGSG